ncbi:MAG TPA: right-handed parallel beta-helix repeat-containing protein, partial [Flavitalea sp.]|nr:right-handed parallel beta-helix repeat-containing protein [Flavitalea sp.]
MMRKNRKMWRLNQITLFSLLFFLCALYSFGGKGRAYYLNASGDDTNDGSRKSPWKSIAKINAIHLQQGDSILFGGSQTFEGELTMDSVSGNFNHPVILGSYGAGHAIINARNGAAIAISRCKYIRVSNLGLQGSGRKLGNTRNGFAVEYSAHITIDSLIINGFQKSGLLIFSSAHIQLTRVHAFNNGFAGVHISAQPGTRDSHHITLTAVTAENNPGDPTVLDNHSGNGIVAGYCRKVLIDRCTAFNNGWDMPRKGNGPIGIWCFEADSVIIQRCISYNNKTSFGGEDGGGFDLDGGVTNSIIQYCLTYNNEGSGFGIFQYAGASIWKNNIIRFNVSYNDGTTSAARAGVYVWSDTLENGDFSGLIFHNNLILNRHGAAIHFAKASNNRDFRFYNNILVGEKIILRGSTDRSVFQGNDWWSISDGFNVGGIKDLKKWSASSGKEKRNGKLTGLNLAPQFIDSTVDLIRDPRQLSSFRKFSVKLIAQLLHGGVDIQQE